MNDIQKFKKIFESKIIKEDDLIHIVDELPEHMKDDYEKFYKEMQLTFQKMKATMNRRFGEKAKPLIINDIEYLMNEYFDTKY